METKIVEIARVFSFKLNVGNFESRDFFCSQKAECEEKDAVKTSEALYLFCKTEVMKSVNKFIEENKPESEKVIQLDQPYSQEPITEEQERIRSKFF
jgi:gas vesicle protein